MALHLLLATVVAVASQSAQPVMTPTPFGGVIAPSATITPAVLAKGTMVRLMVLNEVNSRDHHAGHRFALRVDEDVKVGGVTVIPVGAKGWGEVVGAQGTGAVGKSGRMATRLLYVEVRGKQIALDGQREAAGGGGTGQAVVSLIAFGPLGLLMKGNNATLKAGEIINGYTMIDTAFDRAAVAVTP